MILTIKDVTVHHRKLEVVRRVSLNVPKGSIVGLLGANGSGKSTVLRTVSGLKKPTSGEIWFEGKSLAGKAAHEIVHLGIAQVPEGKGLFPFMSVLENLQMGAYSRTDKAEIEETLAGLLRRFPILRQRINDRVEMLSGGQQQVVAIARALMTRPKLLLLDEPCQGLAPLVVKELAEVIRGVNEQGISIVIVEHNVHVALGLSQKIYILDQGQIVFEGGSKELSEGDYVKRIYLGE